MGKVFKVIWYTIVGAIGLTGALLFTLPLWLSVIIGIVILAHF